MARRVAACASLLLLPLAARCASVTLGAGEYATASLSFVQAGCFQLTLSPSSEVGGTLVANTNTAAVLLKNGMTPPAALDASELAFTSPAAGPASSYDFLLTSTAFKQLPDPVDSRWTTGGSCQIRGRNESCYGVFNYCIGSFCTPAAGPDDTWLLTLLYAPPAGSAAAPVTVEVGVEACGDVTQTGGMAAWQSILPPSQPVSETEAGCYDAYFAQLGGADVPVSPDAATCAACGKLGVCPVRASLYGAFYAAFEIPSSLEAFGRTAIWQKCVPDGDGGAHLAYNVPLGYTAGVYRFLDANGNLAEQRIDWCKLELNEDGLKLAVILPLGLFGAVSVTLAYFQWAGKRAEKRRLESVAAARNAKRNSELGLEEPEPDHAI